MQGRRFRVAIALATSALMLALGAGTLVLLERMRQTAQAAAFDTVERSARVVETAVNRHLLAVDGMLAGLPGIVAALPRSGTGAPSGLAVSRLLRDLNFQNFTFRDLMLVGADGRVWAAALPGSRNRMPPVDPAALKAAAQPGAIAILGPAHNANTGEWAIYLARSVDIGGIGSALAVAEVPVSLITMLLGPYGESKSMRLTVERSGGLLLAATPHDEGRMGQALGSLPSEDTPDGIARAGTSRFDGERVYRAVRPTLYQDLYVTASVATDVALADWRKDRNGLVAGMLGLGTMLGAFAVAINLAMRQRERNEAERTRAREVLENAIESLSDGFVMFDADDRLVVCNQRYRDFYAVTGPFVVPGIKFSDMIREGAKRGQYPQAGPDIEGFVREIQTWHKGNHPPIERLLPDGRWVLVTERGTPDGGTVGIRTDITALKHAMSGLSAARDQAAAATEAKSRFLARMSHELRTPLNGVLGLAQALAMDPSLPDAAREQARTLELSGRHLLAVANDALDLARIETGRLELQPTATALPALLESCLTMVRPAARHQDVELVLDADPALPRHVMVDETRLRQVLLNLLSNAVKFAPARSRVTLCCRVAGATDAQGRVPLGFEVRDEGPGVPPDQRQAIFGDFVQVERTGTPDGAGLGLAIAAYLVDRMQGRIGCTDNLRSRSGSGAMFWAEITLAPAGAPPAEEPMTAQDQTATAPQAARPLRILVADDVPANLMVARALLETGGHTVDTVADGALALAALEAADAGTGPGYDAVLMDVMMPRMNGLEAARAIRALPGPSRLLPIIAVTASAYAEDVAACHDAGMDDHVVKPIDRQGLLRKLAGFTAAPRRTAPQPTPQREAARDDFAELPLLRPESRESPRLLIPGLDEETALRLVPEFMREIRTGRDELRQADPGNPAAIVGIAHRLAGSAATLGAERLTAAARAVEATAKQARGGEAGLHPAQRERLLDIAAETLQALEATLSLAAPAGE
jgi:signal transduction histidine kinase/CheY-like chemotaxis protein/HPt (histidine-containing phosphotransfer) domain-containing protein